MINVTGNNIRKMIFKFYIKNLIVKSSINLSNNCKVDFRLIFLNCKMIELLLRINNSNNKNNNFIKKIITQVR